LSVFCYFHTDVKPYSNFATIHKVEEMEDEKGHTNINDDVSKISLDDGSYASLTTGFKSTFYRNTHQLKAEKPCYNPRRSRGTTLHGVTSLGLPWILDSWHDTSPCARMSLQVQLPSGADVYKTCSVRVSTDQKSIILNFPMSIYISSPSFAFNTYILGMEEYADDDEDVINYVLENHPKVISRKRSIAKICERNQEKEMMYEQRVPLGRRVNREFATVKQDRLFNGKKFVNYPDGSCHVHLEMVCDSGDVFTAETPAVNFVDATGGGIPEEVSVMGNSMGSTEQPMDIKEPEPTPSGEGFKFTFVKPKSTYDGMARRSRKGGRSGRKRVAKKQDDWSFMGNKDGDMLLLGGGNPKNDDVTL